MRTNLFSSILLMAVVTLFCQCSKTEFNNFSDVEQMENVPETSKQFGLSVAKELNVTIRNLHKQGVDYSNANETPEFREIFYNDFFKASPSAVKTRSSAATVNITPEEFRRRVNSLTKIQLSFIDRIIKECSASTSEADFYNRLKTINNDIYETVPEVQQERLFNVTSVLYYGMQEIQKLERQGLMIPTQQSNMQHLLLKTRSESGGNFGSNCRKFLATTWAIAVGEPTPAGEIVASVITVLVAGVWLYEVVVCSKSEAGSDCVKYASLCVGSGYECDACYRECMNDGAWPFYKCPIRPY